MLLYKSIKWLFGSSEPGNEKVKTEKPEPVEECHTQKVVFHEICIQDFVTGQTFGTEHQFINKVDQQLKGSGIHLRRETYNQNSDRLLLLFCPIVSRVGTDIGNALEKIAPGREIILVVMHHAPNESLALHTDSRSEHQNSAIIGCAHCRFSQASGLYRSAMNTTAIASVSSVLQKKVDRNQADGQR